MRLTRTSTLSYIALAVVIGVLFISSSILPVSAQEVTPEPASSSSVIFEQETLRPEIDALTISYRGIIEDYRNKERLYTIAKKDYEQLQTLRSLEEAVNATREVIVARTDVLLTYFELLKLELREAEGVVLQTKLDAIKDVEAEIMYLREYKATAEQADTREKVLNLTPEFELHQKILMERGYYSLSLISIGKLQAVHDKSVIIKDDIAVSLQDDQVDTLKTAQRQRALDQTTQTLGEVNAILYKQSTALNKTSAQGSYTTLRDELSTTYSQLSLSINYLRELLVL